MKTFGVSILRGLTRSPSFTIVAVATLAMGIGVNATLFSLADAVMFRPFPFAQQDRLVIAGEDQTATRSEVSYANFIDWRARTRVFDGLSDEARHDQNGFCGSYGFCGYFFLCVLWLPPAAGAAATGGSAAEAAA